MIEKKMYPNFSILFFQVVASKISSKFAHERSSAMLLNSSFAIALKRSSFMLSNLLASF
jgi:hypothetical protein